jgi:hypothetical protein
VRFSGAPLEKQRASDNIAALGKPSCQPGDDRPVNGAPELSNPTRRALTAFWEKTPQGSNGIDPRATMTDLRKIIWRIP